jgi:hypothetical protein
VVLYALSQTFFSPPRQVAVDIQELQRRGSLEASQRRSTDATTLFRGATTTQVSSTSEVPASRPARQPAVVGVPRVDPTRVGGGSSSRPGTQTQRPESSAVRIGQRPQATGLVPAAPQAGAGAEDDGSASRPQRPRTGALTQPPTGVETDKRDASSDPPAPPVRSSVPARRPR